jgi:hypothetical protein
MIRQRGRAARAERVGAVLTRCPTCLALPLGRRRCGMSDLGSAVRRRPLLSVVIVTHLVTRPLAPTRKPGRWIFR